MKADALGAWEEPDEGAPLERPRTLVLLGRAAMLALAALALAENAWPIARWPEPLISTAFYFYRIGWLVVLALLVAFWASLFRFARAAGGTNYALGYVLLSVLLAPGLIGIFLVPHLVVDDVAGGQAARRRARAHGFREGALRTALYLLALIVLALPLGLVEPRLALAAPVLALFLQRLVLPWVRRPAAG